MQSAALDFTIDGGQKGPVLGCRMNASKLPKGCVTVLHVFMFGPPL